MAMSDPEQNAYDPADARYSKLAAGLRDLDREHVFVPPTVDTVVMRQAKEHLNPARRGWPWRFKLAPWLASAACLVAGALLGWLLFLEPQGSMKLTKKEDLDGNGQVDILDAFFLARKLQAGTAGEPHLDINGDGLVNQNDIDAIASQVVALEEKS
jgi:hypothetical protein